MTLSFEERAQRAWEDLSISDNFIFLRVMQNKDLCKRLIERILHIKIRDLSYPHTEKTIDLRLDSKGSTDKFSRAVLAHLFRPVFVDKSST